MRNQRFVSGMALSFFAVIANLAYLQAASAAEALPGCTKLIDEAGAPFLPISPKLIQQPEPNVASEAEIGQPLISALNASEYPLTITLAEDVTYTGAADGKLAGFVVTIPAGSLQAYTTGKGVALYSSAGVKVTFQGKPIPDAKGGIAVKNDITMPSRIWWLNIDSSWLSNTVHSYGDDVPKAHVTSLNCLGPSKDNLTREIVYSGISKGTISLLYREYTNDMARPAFSQELSYDLGAGNEIGYKGARIKIDKADNVSVKYEVLKPFD